MWHLSAVLNEAKEKMGGSGFRTSAEIILYHSIFKTALLLIIVLEYRLDLLKLFSVQATNEGTQWKLT